MVQFSYSFCMALLHSLWQAALLAMLYYIVDRIIHKHNAPLAKRNFLYTAIAAQLLLFGITCCIYFFDTTTFSAISAVLQPVTGYLESSSIQWITPWFFAIYSLVLVLKMTRAIYTWLSFKQQFRMGLQKPPVELKLFTELKAFQFGVKRKVKLWLSSSIHTPVTFGFFRPIILLPVALLNNISTQQAETLILHELTHIRTNDYLFNWFLIIAESIFFFNPFVISLCNKIRLEREKNCDIQVMSFRYSPALYAQTLLQAERMKQLVPNFQLAAVNKKKHLLKRIQFFTSDRVMNQPLRFNIVAPLVGLVLLLMLSTAIMFQAGNQGSSLIVADNQFMPFNDYTAPANETEQPVVINNTPVLDHIRQEPTAQALSNKAVITKKPAVEQEPEMEIVYGPAEMNYAMPVTISENDASKRIIIKEEGSGTSTIKTYFLSFENGKWILRPEWTISAMELKLDSLAAKVDSLKLNIEKAYADQQ